MDRRCSRAGGCDACGGRSSVFGFHLAALDLRQNSEVHERVVGELLAVGAAGHRLPLARRGRARAAAGRGTGDPRLLGSPYAEYSAESRSEIEILQAAARNASALRRRVRSQLRDLEVRRRLRRARGRAAAARGRPVPPGGRDSCTSTSCRCSKPSRDLRRRVERDGRIDVDAGLRRGCSPPAARRRK